MMSQKIIGLLLGLVLIVAMPLSADQNVTKIVSEGCRAEIEIYCEGVKPGNGRILACLYSHTDKLTATCEYALYDAAAQLERAVAALSYVANECAVDLKKHCRGVVAGDGRLFDCIKKNEKIVSSRCKEAIKEVGLEKVKK